MAATPPEETTAAPAPPQQEAATPKRHIEWVVDAGLANAKEGIVTHRVTKGDTLWEIAERYVHDPWAYQELATNSGIDNPDLIHPGEEIRIVFVSRKPRPQ